ncbi:cytochrome c oxidase subunit III [Aestuariicella hydrocarbonica]|uniref:Cytochrome c oxidase subunit III n=1 Tax=Pseudomaricurvus hydrocarbonicus TaxID=1470433 RepID=A0A9E5T3I7_9GAMM|nr:cytochrome c oxidase subunit 3 [Aestuariicella hydrocarbonica]NHO67024.1 cytochrome c oxidase subunit III [Aestuariicella hydrocarbonica]
MSLNFFRTLQEKPWLQPDAVLPERVMDRSDINPKKLPLIVFLGIVSVFFFLFLITFLARSQYPDFQALAGETWQPFYHPQQLWINTGLLLIACVALQVALMATRRQNIHTAQIALCLALLFTLQFGAAQLLLWRHLYKLGFYMASNPANSYFYLLTALHGLHLIGGLFVLVPVILRSFGFFRPATTAPQQRPLQPPRQQQLQYSLELCALYWHYLFVIWLLIFFFNASSPAVYKTLAALCGY